MDESNTKERSRFVTHWLWAGILGNAYFALKYPTSTYRSGLMVTIVLCCCIAVIIANILVLNWKIIGFLIYFAATITIVLLMIFYFQFIPVTSIVLGVIHFSIYFGVLNIRKNGISVWKYLLTEANVNSRQIKIWTAAAFGTIILLLAIAIFPVTRLYGNTIVMFAPQKFMSWNDFRAKILGNYVLKTEYGEMKIGHLSSVYFYVYFDSLDIRSEVFKSGRASHNLVFLGGEMPEHLYIKFNHGQITRFNLNHQDINVYSVPVRVSGIDINSPRNTANILFSDGVRFLEEHITLTDSTELNVTTAYLSIYIDEQRWVLAVPRRDRSLFVKRPGETEFTAYRSITFKENWGEFIEGELLEE